MIHDEDPSDSTPGIRPLPQASDLSGITRIELHPRPTLGDYLAAMRLADAEAGKRLGGEHMLLSWYDLRNPRNEQVFERLVLESADWVNVVALDEQRRSSTLEDLQRDRFIWNLYLEGIRHMRNNDYQKAIESWEKVLEAYPNNVNTLNNLEQARLRLLSEQNQ